MRRSMVPIAEKRPTESNTKHNLSQRKVTTVGPRITSKNFSVSMVNTRSSKENKTKEGAEGKQTEPAIEIDLETPDSEEDNGVDTDAECRGTKSKVDGTLTDRHCGGHDGQHARNSKGRVSSKKNVIHREDSDDGWNEVERRSGGRTESRERQNIWNSLHGNNRGQPRRLPS